jgi:hypothetical protein
VGTKSTRSAGTQVTARGVTQGTTLVGPQSGLPIAEVVDVNGVRRLAVDGSFSANIENVNVDLDPATDGVYIANSISGNQLYIHPDGSIDANTNITASSGDNIAISDGTNTLVVNADGSINVTTPAANVILADLLTELKQKTEPTDAQNIRAITSVTDSISVPGVATAANQATTNTNLTNLLTELQQKTEPSDAQNIRALDYTADSVTVFGLNDTNTGIQDLLTELQQKTEPANAQNIRALDYTTDSVTVDGLSTTNSLLTSIDGGIPTALGQTTATNSMPVVIASDQGPITVTGTLNADLDAFSVTPDNVMTVGTIDGTKTGTKYGFVNNIRNQILASHDRQQSITYADFGNKDQRVTQIDYISPTFSGVTARKVLNYTLVGTKYRRDSINWVII